MSQFTTNFIESQIYSIRTGAGVSNFTYTYVSRIVLYSPEQHGGYGIADIWHLQGGEKLKFFIMHYSRHDITGRLFKISLQWLRLEAGVPKPFYTYIYNDIESTLSYCWIKHLFEYLDSCKAHFMKSIHGYIKPHEKTTSFYKTYSSNLTYLECAWHY